MSKRMSDLSLEYVQVPVTTNINPTAFTVEMAFKAPGVDPVPADWQTASWVTVNSRYLAQTLVGPGGTITLAVGTYAVWVRVTALPEIPVKPAKDHLTIW